MVLEMLRPLNVFVCCSNEEDFINAITRESCDVDGVIYIIFPWSIEFT